MAEEEDQKYEVLQKIGQGSFGIIRKVRHKSTGTILCRKEISYSRMSDKEKQQLGAELDILKTLRHPNVVQYYHRSHLKSSSDIHLYMEYCGNGDLGGYIKKMKKENVLAEEEFVWQIFAQLVSALYRCHEGEDAPVAGQSVPIRQTKGFQTKQGMRQVILHRDLKPENVFLGENNAVKLGDFGLSKIIASHDFASTYVGTPFYMSPEICAAERYSHHSDVWSLGCILYELATRNVPFDARTHIELVMKIKAGRIKPLPDVYSRELWEVISSCLKVDPRQRPDTAQLLNVPQIKAASLKLEQVQALETANTERMRLTQERDSALTKVNAALKQIQELQAEITILREAGKKAEMAWEARARLAIDQHAADADQKHHNELERQKAHLLQQFEAAVEKQVDEKLKLHLASLPQSHGLAGEDGAGVASHVRSSTPPPGKSQSTSFAYTTTTAGSDGSSNAAQQDNVDTTLDTDLSSLSIMEDALGEDVSPLAQRTKPPPKRTRQGFMKAKTFANGGVFGLEGYGATASPMDVQMADPSPMPRQHAAPMSIKGLSLSPRRHGGLGQDRLSSAVGGLRKNIFADANLRPSYADDLDSSFADEDLMGEEPESPSRPTSGMSNASGDPFKAIAAQQGQQQQAPPKRMSRPSLQRQQTMPVSMQPAIASRQRSNPFGGLISRKPTTSPDKNQSQEKENRPPSRSNVPIPSFAHATSPKRSNTTRDGKVLTPSRKAPPPPPTAATTTSGLPPRAATSSNLARLALLSPGKSGSRGKTLVELSQARAAFTSQPDLGLGLDQDALMAEGRRLLPSPAKWDVGLGEEMPSPFLAKKGRLLR
ncbi:G2-specific serine/threonine protein kinase [Recurvomyces mirabilis]|uniref:non-specific serine/threonine protein kinase n=1 Tax=Recurvomyces mirabilis TaxID=574656 RepID=A0AAE0TPT6_9PEZI|nr:G2-specific serine/threonine protein kinase [Recurvomyces mirabilis]KAK5153478.1 G2-specific serine/threonine protein kinase [Recurvomyces mirabilis]